MEKRKQQLKQHIEGLSFGLKDISLTTAKHNDYKSEEFKQFLNENSESIEQYLNALEDNFLSDLGLSPSYYAEMELKTKSEIRGFKTYINGRVRFMNTEFIKGLIDDNATTINRFAIKFYLHFYDRINEIMHDILKARFEEVTA